MKPIDLFLSRFPDARHLGNGWHQARCPAHDDQHASFGFREQPDEHVMVKCQAGCTQGDILTAMGLVVRQLYPDATTGGNGHVKAYVPICYPYTDAKGNLLFQSVRCEGKRFFQRRPDGMGGWINDLKGIKRVLYRLPEVIAAVATGQTIWICEGEKDADNLRALGLCATTNAGGAGKWQDGYTATLSGADVVILPDNDDPGNKHAEQVASAIVGKARRVRMLVLPDLPEKGDVSDWLDAGGTREELEALAEGVQPHTCNSAAEILILTDYTNAERLAARHGNNLRYCKAMHRWYVWDGLRWREDETGEVTRRAVESARSMRTESALVPGEAGKKLFNWAKTSENNFGLTTTIKCLESVTGIAVRATELDVEPMILNTITGVIDLQNGDLLPHCHADMITKLAPVYYDKDATCPLWESFLARIFQDNTELISFIRRGVGYSLTGSTVERAMFILYGNQGKNGKSTLLETMRAMLGDYAARTPTSTLMQKRESGIPNDIARLQGARFVSASETEDGRRLAESTIKDMTGGDTISARFMRAEWFEYIPQFKLWLSTNHKPQIKGTDQAIWDRIRLVPFHVRLPQEEQDPMLGSKLRAELPGILAWAVRGCLEWQEHGLGMPAEVQAATDQYRADMDTLAGFLQECCVLDKTATAKASVLYERYCQWCKENNERPETGTAFGLRLQERDFKKVHTRSGWYYLGIEVIYVSPEEECDGCDECDPNSGLIPYEKKTLKTIVKSLSHPSHPSQRTDQALDYEPGAEG